MSKTLRVALLALLVTLFAAATSVAGPAGPKEGDPDSPMVMLPTYSPNGADRNGRVGDRLETREPRAMSHRHVSGAWETLLRVYFRLSGIRVG